MVARLGIRLVNVSGRGLLSDGDHANLPRGLESKCDGGAFLKPSNQ